MSPVAAMSAAAAPLRGGAAVGGYVAVTLAAAAAIVGWTIRRVRVWNPSREVRLKTPEPETDTELSEAGPDVMPDDPSRWRARQPRGVWSNPVLWREVRTWAYGKRIVVIRLVFLALFVGIAAVLASQVRSGVAMERGGRVGRMLPAVTLPAAALGVVSVLLINALAVGSVTGERDGMALDLLMVTDLKPSEFIFGKLLGVMYVGKEMIGLTLAAAVGLAVTGVVTWESLIYMIAGALVLYLFAAMLGVHCGLNYASSRTATLASLGTVFFLCVGIAVCMTIMVSFRGSFTYQLPPFLVLILGGGAALFATLGWRNPSAAVMASSFTLPLLTFYAITQFLLQTDNLYVLVAVASGYVFTTAAMMVPALSEFDVALD